MEQPRNSLGPVLLGVVLIICGASFCFSGLRALETHDLVPGTWKRPPMSGPQALVAGVAFLVGGSFWLWTCFRKDR